MCPVGRAGILALVGICLAPVVIISIYIYSTSDEYYINKQGARYSSALLNMFIGMAIACVISYTLSICLIWDVKDNFSIKRELMIIEVNALLGLFAWVASVTVPDIINVMYFLHISGTYVLILFS